MKTMWYYRNVKPRRFSKFQAIIYNHAVLQYKCVVWSYVGARSTLSSRWMHRESSVMRNVTSYAPFHSISCIRHAHDKKPRLMAKCEARFHLFCLISKQAIYPNGILLLATVLLRLGHTRPFKLARQAGDAWTMIRQMSRQNTQTLIWSRTFQRIDPYT